MEGGLEIIRQPEAEGFGSAHGDIGVTAEIPVDLEGEQYKGQSDLQPGIFRIGGKDGLDDGGNLVGDHQLAEEAQQDQRKPFLQILQGKTGSGADLRQDIPGAFDGTGDQLGEKCQIEGKVQEMSLGCGRAAVYIHIVADGLEKNKGNSQRKQAACRSKLPVQMQRCQNRIQIFQQETGILEVTQDPELTENREDQKRLCRAAAAGGFGAGSQNPSAVGEQDDRSQQEQVAAVRAGIEKTAGGQEP